MHIYAKFYLNYSICIISYCNISMIYYCIHLYVYNDMYRIVSELLKPQGDLALHNG